MISLQQTWQQQRQQRQQEIAQRQRQVQEMLAELRQSRQQQAGQVRQELQTFQQQLQKQTENFLSICATNRTLMSQQLNQELDGFRWQLHNSVSALRQTLQAQLRQLKVNAQNQWQGHQQKRLQSQLELMQNLAEYVENLQAEVQIQLVECSIIRQIQAQQLRQTLQEDRARRRAEVISLFQELSAFRAELRTYCTELRQLVWGDPVSVAPATSKDSMSLAASKVVISNAAEQTMVISKSLSTETAEPPQTEEGVEVKNKKAEAPPTTRGIEFSEPIEAPKAIDLSALNSKATTSREPISLEELIYIYLNESRGASLTEIETALTINRFQSVQALRNLIRKGFVTQRDRMYLIQEEVKL